MTKSKNHGPALFDLLGDSPNEADESLRPAQGAASSPPPTPTITRRPDSSQALSEQAIVPSRVTVSGGLGTSSEAGSSGTGRVRRRRRLLEFDDECVTLSLTSLSAAVAVFVLSVGLLGLYELGRTRGQSAGQQTGYRAGRASYEADATSEIEAARNAPPASHLIKGLLESAATGAGGAAGADSGSKAGSKTGPQTPWVQGLTYIVAQEFAPRAEQDAHKTQAFLRSQGIDTALLKQDNGWFQLVTTQGYDRSDRIQRDLADKFLAKEHEVGAAYYASGGGYRLEGYFKTLRNERW